MKAVAPKPFFFEAGERAVLLLHGFTGSSADVRMLGRYLQKRGYTCYAPHYKGHGVPPEQLVITGPIDWWEDVVAGYELLKSKGYKEIAVAGLSLGGVFSLKLGYTLPVKGIISMCAPMFIKSEEMMYKGVLAYAEEYKRREQKSIEQINIEMAQLMRKTMPSLKALQQLLQEVRKNIDLIYTPTLVLQARHDEMIQAQSAAIIYNDIQTEHKRLIWYEHSTHVITVGKEKEKLHEDSYQFFESLAWKNNGQS